MNSKGNQNFYDHFEEKWVPIEYAENKIKKAKGKAYY